MTSPQAKIDPPKHRRKAPAIASRTAGGHAAAQGKVEHAKAVLACSRERQVGLAANPFLEAMAERLEKLGNIPATALGTRPWRCQLAAIRRFEKLRFNDRRLSEEKLEWLIGVMVAMLEKMEVKPAGTSEWTSAIQGHRRVRELLENFTALEVLRKLDTASVGELKSSLPPKAKPAPGYRRPAKLQPPGGKYSPISSSPPESE